MVRSLLITLVVIAMVVVADVVGNTQEAQACGCSFDTSDLAPGYVVMTDSVLTGEYFYNYEDARAYADETGGLLSRATYDWLARNMPGFYP